MKELGQDKADGVANLQGILEQLEAALADVDRLQLMVIGAQLSQVIDEVKALLDA